MYNLFKTRSFISKKHWAGFFLPSVFICLSSLSTTISDEFFDYQYFWENSEKVYSGVVQEVLSSIRSGEGVNSGFEQVVTVEVYLSWKGHISSVEYLNYFLNPLMNFQPLLEEGTSVLVFARVFPDDFGYEFSSYGSFSTGTFLEFAFGGEGIEYLMKNQFDGLKSFPVAQEGNKAGRNIADEWYFDRLFGLLFWLGDSWYISEKAGYIYFPISDSKKEGSWFYQIDLEWVWISNWDSNWLWSAERGGWIYLMPTNKAHIGMYYYDLISSQYRSLPSCMEWYRIGFNK